MVDPVNPDMSATFSDIITQGGYAPPTDTTALGTTSKAKAAVALGAVSGINLHGNTASLAKGRL